MKLYYSPGACSLSPHIVLREAGLPFELQRVDIRSKQLKREGGGDFLEINDKGMVPTLELDDGQRLTEGPAIVQFLADQNPESGLAPRAGTMARYRVMEWLNFISTELHKGFSPLFSPATPEEHKKTVKEALAKRFELTQKRLEGKVWATGDTFTVVDAYLYTVMRWAPLVGVDLTPFPGLVAYLERVAARPAVREAMLAEGILKA
jgi:glutathione S-transferase